MLLYMLLSASPLDIWHDPIFQVIATAFAATIGCIFSILIYRKQHIQREITYQVISNVPIVSLNKETTEKIQTQFNEEIAKDLRYIVLKVWNSGNVAVTSKDYVEKIKFNFEGGTVLGGEVVETEPRNLIEASAMKHFLVLTSGSESVELPTFSLNPKQTINLGVLLAGTSGKFSRKGLINNGRIMEHYPELDNEAREILIGAIFFIILFLLIASIIVFFLWRFGILNLG